MTLKVTPFGKFVVLLNCLVPVTLLGWDAYEGRLGANPVNFAILTTGMLALIFLALTLLVTPAMGLAGVRGLAPFRRMFGLCAFFHAALHFLLFFAFDRAGHVGDTFSEMVKRPYLVVGTIGLVLMVPLAATSVDAAIRRLGGKRWRQLHRLTYVVAVAAGVHYYMQAKADVSKPLIYGSLIGALLGYRAIAAVSKRARGKAPAVVASPRTRAALAARGGAKPPKAAEATLTFAASGKSMPMTARRTVLEAAEDLGVEIPYDCRSGTCGTCKSRLLSGHVAMASEDALDDADRAGNLILACQATCLDDVVIDA